MNTFSNPEAAQRKTVEPDITARCPECDSSTSVAGEISIGRQLGCERCGAVLEIVGLSPVLLDYAFIAPLNRHHSLLSE
jgi:uncharacterized paraquat-inducible protein A